MALRFDPLGRLDRRGEDHRRARRVRRRREREPAAGSIPNRTGPAPSANVGNHHGRARHQ